METMESTADPDFALDLESSIIDDLANVKGVYKTIIFFIYGVLHPKSWMQSPIF